MSRVAVIGSRDYTRLTRVSAVVRSLPPGTVIVSGGAPGVDEAAERAARAFGYRTDILPVDTVGLPEDPEERRREFGRRAYARNTRIVESADTVIAFWTDCSRPECRRGPEVHKTHGTAHAISEARRLGKHLRQIGPSGVES